MDSPMIRGQTGRIACPDSRAAGSGSTEPGTPSMTAPGPFRLWSSATVRMPTADREADGWFHQPGIGCPISGSFPGIHMHDEGVGVASLNAYLGVRALSTAWTVDCSVAIGCPITPEPWVLLIPPEANCGNQNATQSYSYQVAQPQRHRGADVRGGLETSTFWPPSDDASAGLCLA